MISKVIRGENGAKVEESVVEINKTGRSEERSCERNEHSAPSKCTCQTHKCDGIATIISETITKNIRKGTTIIKLEIEFSNN